MLSSPEVRCYFSKQIIWGIPSLTPGRELRVRFVTLGYLALTQSDPYLLVVIPADLPRR